MRKDPFIILYIINLGPEFTFGAGYIDRRFVRKLIQNVFPPNAVLLFVDHCHQLLAESGDIREGETCYADILARDIIARQFFAVFEQDAVAIAELIVRLLPPCFVGKEKGRAVGSGVQDQGHKLAIEINIAVHDKNVLVIP